MTWGAVAGAAISVVGGYLSNRQKKKQAEKAAKAASQPTTETTTSTPWGPSEQYRLGIMEAAYNRALGIGQEPAAGGGGGRRRRGGGGGGGGGGGTGGAIGIGKYIKDVLSGKYLQGNPFLQEAVIDPLNAEYAKRMGKIDLAGEASGFTPGSSNLQLERAANEGERSRAVAQVRMDDYNERMKDIMQAMGYGTQYDIAVMNNATERRGQNLAHSAAMAGINLDREKWGMQKLAMGADIINAMSGAYGTRTTTTQGPQRESNVGSYNVAQGLGDAFAGAQLGRDFTGGKRLYVGNQPGNG